jgi:SAM-dependent methyltransferase
MSSKEVELLSTLFKPYAPDHDSYCLANVSVAQGDVCDFGWPMPPNNLRLGYGDDNESYLSLTDEHVRNMVAALDEASFSIGNASTILDFGCSNGRMMRRLPNHTSASDIWGVDISAPHLLWAKLNLSPPFNFVVNTYVPHLPFTDRRFDLIYAGSVFTHIDDLALSWFAELARVLTDDGRLYITIHDEHTIQVLEGKDWWLPKLLYSHPDFLQFIENDYGMFAIQRSAFSHVFYRQEFFRKYVAGMFDVMGFHPGAYSQHQTGVVLKKSS